MENKNKSSDNKSLEKWINIQRQAYKKGIAPKEQIDKLKSIKSDLESLCEKKK